MKILLTGATGYIGKKLLPSLLNEGHQVVCLVRDPRRFQNKYKESHKIEVIKGDLLDLKSLSSIPLILMLPITLCIPWVPQVPHFQN